MSDYKYLPNGLNKAYSPVGVGNLFRKSIKEEGDVKNIFLKPTKYKQLIELWYGSVLAVAIYQLTGVKFYMYPSDSPDIHFIDISKNNKELNGFSVEIMTLFKYGEKKFNQSYEELAQNIWDKKGKVDYDRTELFLISRIEGSFNVDLFIGEIKKYQWKFLRIWLGVYSQGHWMIFDIMPYFKGSNISRIDVDLTRFSY